MVLVIDSNAVAKMPISWIFVLALLLRCIAIFAMPLLEDDHFRYLWDAFQTQVEGSPYRYAPAEFFPGDELPELWQDILSGINNPELKTIYGPVLQGIFLLAYWIAPGELLPFQAILMALDILILLVLALLKLPQRWLLLYAIHPLVLQEGMASAHPDLVVGLLLLLALLAWQHRKSALMGGLLGVALATKVSVLVVLPAFFLLAGHGGLPIWLRIDWRWLGVGLATMMAFVGLTYFPVFVSGASELESLLVFGNQWRFNPLAFRLFDELLPITWARELCGLMILGGSLYFIGRHVWGHHSKGPPPILLTLLLLLLLSPVVNPWYWLWLLPTAVYLQRWRILVMAAIAPISYWNSTVLSDAGLMGSQLASHQFLVPWAITILQLCVMAWVLAGEWKAFTRGQSISH